MKLDCETISFVIDLNWFSTDSFRLPHIHAFLNKELFSEGRRYGGCGGVTHPTD